jgi:hypothetical protein
MTDYVDGEGDGDDDDRDPRVRGITNRVPRPLSPSP